MFVLHIFIVDIEEKVCPVIMDLSSPDSIDDFRPEAVAVSFSSQSDYIVLLYMHIIFVHAFVFYMMKELVLMKDMGSEMCI